MEVQFRCIVETPGSTCSWIIEIAARVISRSGVDRGRYFLNLPKIKKNGNFRIFFGEPSIFIRALPRGSKMVTFWRWRCKAGALGGCEKMTGGRKGCISTAKRAHLPLSAMKEEFMKKRRIFKDGVFCGKRKESVLRKFGGIDFLNFLPWLVYILMCGSCLVNVDIMRDYF